MSVHQQGPNHYKVHWKEGARQRSRTFRGPGSRDAADTFDAKIKLDKALGVDLSRDLDRAHLTLDDFIRGVWADHADGFAAKTRRDYRWVLTHHMGTLPDERLRVIDTPMITRHVRKLRAAGLSTNTALEVLAKIGAILEVAVGEGLIDYNPVRSMKKPRRDPRQLVVRFEPIEVDALIAATTGRDRAIMVLGGWLGLRPIEIRLAPWARLHDGRFTIEQEDTKPSAKPRTITVPAAAAHALREWRLEAGRPGDDEPIIGLDARQMNYWNTTLKRVVGDTLNGARDGKLTTYSLRHSHASMLHYAGFSTPRAAERMGHTAVEHLHTYARVLDGLGDQRWPDLDTLIAATREAQETRRVSPGFPAAR
jgi:integrase